MGQEYSQVTPSDRVTIDSMLQQGCRVQDIAKAVGKHKTSIYRELSRNNVGASKYSAQAAQASTAKRRRSAGLGRRKLGADIKTPRWRHVINGLRSRWSPQQIVGRLEKGHPLAERIGLKELQVSHETIYAAIYAMPRGTLRAELVSLLRMSHKARMPRTRGQGRFTGLRDMTAIALRPPEVAARVVPGDWEGDLIKGQGNRSSVGTLVVRVSRYTMLVKLDDASAANVLEGFTRRLRSVPASLRRTMTYDQGTEMASHKLLAKQLHIDVFFCDPHSPWQRGTNENTNGLLRQYMPKGIDLSQFSHQELLAIEHSLNNRPRKVLGFRTPAEVFAELKLNDIAGVALQA